MLGISCVGACMRHCVAAREGQYASMVVMAEFLREQKMPVKIGKTVERMCVHHMST